MASLVRFSTSCVEKVQVGRFMVVEHPLSFGVMSFRRLGFDSFFLLFSPELLLCMIIRFTRSDIPSCAV